MEKVIGIRKFGSHIDITDPCYDRDVWCRMNQVEIVPGEYECYVEIFDNEQTEGWGNRVAVIGIRLAGTKANVLADVGFIGVDSGLAGFFDNKPDYSDDQWAALCNQLNDYPSIHLYDDGFFASSGYGDGEYPVYTNAVRGTRATCVEICFIEENCDEEE